MIERLFFSIYYNVWSEYEYDRLRIEMDRDIIRKS